MMFIFTKNPSWLLCIAAVMWLVDIHTLVYCHEFGGTNNTTCLETERRALLEFKHGLEFTNKSLLSNWNDENIDCCGWEGIKCNKYGLVMSLYLGQDVTRKYTTIMESRYYYERIGGEIGPSLLDLPYLEFLDLSDNNFSGKIPASIGALKSLRYLKLSDNSFSGIIPHQLGNLSSLESFDIDGNSDLEVDSLAWICGLSSLEYLNMKYVNLNSATDWFQSITSIPSLTDVYLHYCRLHSPYPLKYVNSTKPLQLQNLDLSNNDMEGEIPDSFSTNLTSLLTLDASENRLSKSSGFLQSGSTSLLELHLDNNKITGLLPDLSNFPSLTVVKVANNEFKDHLEQFLEHGSRLVELDVSSNSFNQVIREDHFMNLTKLQVLSLSYNSIALNFSTWWIPPFQLTVVKLRNCKLGPSFPHWLREQSNLTSLDISNSSISEAIPSWFWNISDQLRNLNISHNSLNSKLPSYMPPCYSTVDLSSNQLYGALPSFSSELSLLYLSNNMFSGGISFLCSLEVGNLYSLELHNNLLSGSLETCWERVNNLEFLNLNNNNFSGCLPHSMGNLSSIMSLSLRNNSLSGELPSSMINWGSLLLLDLGDNQLSGVIPTGMGTNLQKLGLLSLHGNRFRGNIPRALCDLHSVQLLDLSFNNISGMIPSCLNNFTAMAVGSLSTSLVYRVGYIDTGDYIGKYFTTWIAWKGLNREFANRRYLGIPTIIDLSNNRLSGPVPQELASLYKLRSLNLSRNSLISVIPDNIGQLNMLDSLDLSNNLLSGDIPQSMANMSFLSYLDLSSNNLSGKIPSSTQLQSFDASAFNNNPMLCGPPTTNPCHDNRSHTDWDDKREGGIFHEDIWLYISIGVGFIVGFWGVCFTLLLKDSWRQRYFEVLNKWKEGITVGMLVGLSKLKRRFTS